VFELISNGFQTPEHIIVGHDLHHVPIFPADDLEVRSLIGCYGDHAGVTGDLHPTGKGVHDAVDTIRWSIG
jgi:hypothetical protein